MHPVDFFILISIGQVVGWTATIYFESDHRRLAGHLVVTTAGAFAGGYLSLWLISEFSKFSMIFVAFFFSIALLTALRFYNSNKRKENSPAKKLKLTDVPVRPRMPTRKEGISILTAIIFVIAIFLFLGWCKSIEIQGQKIAFNKTGVQPHTSFIPPPD